MMVFVSSPEPLYSEAEAARLLRLPQATLHYWLEGKSHRGHTYPPVIRVDATGDRTLTWDEFIEAAMLRQYRRVENIPMRELRLAIDDLRKRFDCLYPLSRLRPWVDEGTLILREVQERAGLPAEYCFVAAVGGQLMLLPAAESFVRRVDWVGNDPGAWRPHDDAASPVRIRPDLRFGRPSVAGVSTEVVWEHLEADESPEEVAEQFDLKVGQVRWAYAYETSQRAA